MPRRNARYPIDRFRAFILANQHLTLRACARELGVSWYGLRRFAQRHGLRFGRQYIKRDINCREPLRTIFIALHKRDLTIKAIAKQLQRSEPLVSCWRTGSREPSFFDLQNLCQLAGLTLEVSPCMTTTHSDARNGHSAGIQSPLVISGAGQPPLTQSTSSLS